MIADRTSFLTPLRGHIKRTAKFRTKAKSERMMTEGRRINCHLELPVPARWNAVRPSAPVLTYYGIGVKDLNL